MTNPFNLPSVANVRAWARDIVAKRGDAFNNWLYENGLRIDDVRGVIGECPTLVRENVGNPAQGGTNVARLIQVATYPETDFATAFWEYPKRGPLDVPWHRGRYQSQRYNEIHLPYPLAQPILVRVKQWRSWIPELNEVNFEVVEYTLFELDPDRQAKAAETRLARATRQRQ